MCFGEKETGSKTSTPNVDPAYQGYAKSNLDFAQNIQNSGFQPYSGQRVADFSGLQNSAFNVATGATAPNPYLDQTKGQIDQYSQAPGQTVTSDTIANNMSPYLNQYVGYALAPQIAAQDKQFADQNKQLNSTATASNAFGDARAGIERGAQVNSQGLDRMGLIGNAYNSAFNTAIGAGAQDVSNKMAAQQATGSFQEQALNRQLGGASALQGLDASQLQRLASQYGILQGAGTTQQQQQQAQLNVPYSDYLSAQQYPFLSTQLMNSALGSGAAAYPAGKTETSYAPDNSGLALGGALLPGLMALSDARAKEDAEKIGELADGQNIYKFRYKADPSKRVHVGLMAQEVEKRHPEAVTEVGGVKLVNYDLATRLAALAGNLDMAA
jgi:hypothetical protein